MPRLRITASLSLLAVLLGAGATAALTAWPRWQDHAAGSSAVATATMAPVGGKRVPVVSRRHHVSQPVAAVASVPPPPRVIYMTSPRYPVAAARAHRQGVVTLRVRVNMAGHVVRVSVADSSGDVQMDIAARKAVQRWRFQPSSAPPAVLLLPVRFKIN